MYLVQLFDRTGGALPNESGGGTWQTTHAEISDTIPVDEAWDSVVDRYWQNQWRGPTRRDAMGLTQGTFEYLLHSGGCDSGRIDLWFQERGGDLWYEVQNDAHVEEFIEATSLGLKNFVNPQGIPSQRYEHAGYLSDTLNTNHLISSYFTAKIATVTTNYRREPYWRRPNRGSKIRRVRVQSASLQWSSTSDGAIEALVGNDVIGGEYRDALFTELRAQLITRVP